MNESRQDTASSRSSQSPAPVRTFPPHIHEEVQDAVETNAAAATANNKHPLRSFRTPPSDQSSSSLGSNSPEGSMTGERAEGASGSFDLDQDPPSSPQSTAEGDIQKLALGRSSSPAKRTLSESNGDDEEYGHASRSMELDSAKRQKSPKDNDDIMGSPIPSRHKATPSIELNNQRVDDIEMPDESTDGADAQQDDLQQIIGHGQTTDVPSLDEQVAKITQLCTGTPKAGDKGYLVATEWLQRVQSRTTDGLHGDFGKHLREGEIGPVDNSSIVSNGKYPGEKAAQEHITYPDSRQLLRAIERRSW
jgi:hypothetical protein